MNEKNNGDVAVFVGHFAPQCMSMTSAVSIAGNQVQRQILDEMKETNSPVPVKCCSMMPSVAWPKGPLVVRSCSESGVYFPGYINFHVIKHLFFAIRLFFFLVQVSPRFCVQYNSYVLENIALLFYRFFCRNVSLGLIVQDVHVGSRCSFLSRRGLRSLSERGSLYLARFFDLIVPISEAIVEDFGFNVSRSFVFQGGVTAFAEELMAKSNRAPAKLEDIAVFAGALEPHNGIDKLISYWQSSHVPQELHVFGRGSLSESVCAAAKQSPFIIFHGLQTEETVSAWQMKARWNFCFRYSVGLDQRYFFPSKFFNVASAPGAVVVNDFYGLPNSMKLHLAIARDDLSDLKECLDKGRLLSSTESVEARRDVLRSSHSWRSCVTRIVKELKSR